MNRQRLTRVVCYAVMIAIVLCLTWWILHKMDPTSSADFVSDSPDGKYRVAMFCNGVGGNEFEIGLFEGSWPHRELPGNRVQWSTDSVTSSDFRATWGQNKVDVNYYSGYGSGRATASGSVVNGQQQWQNSLP